MQTFYCAVKSCFLVTVMAAGALAAGELRFASENIDVRILPPDTVEVRGEYFFTSSDGAAYTGRVIYPFPADSGAGYPLTVAVRRSDAWYDTPFDRIAQGIAFAVEVPNGGTAAVIVTYRQRFAAGTGRYILTTTAGWGRPLVNSRYSVCIPAGTPLTYLSYECDTVYVSGRDRIYSFFKKRFMPDRDLVFTWKNTAGDVTSRKR